MSGSNSQNENSKKKRKANDKMWKFVSWSPEEHYSECSEQKIKMMQTSEGSSFVTMKIKLKQSDKKRKTVHEEINVSASESTHKDSPLSGVVQIPNNPQNPFLVSEVAPNYVLTTTNLECIQRRDVSSVGSLFDTYSPITNTSAHPLTIEYSELDLLLAQFLAQQPKPPPL